MLRWLKYEWEETVEFLYLTASHSFRIAALRALFGGIMLWFLGNLLGLILAPIYFEYFKGV